MTCVYKYSMNMCLDSCLMYDHQRRGEAEGEGVRLVEGHRSGSCLEAGDHPPRDRRPMCLIEDGNHRARSGSSRHREAARSRKPTPCGLNAKASFRPRSANGGGGRFSVSVGSRKGVNAFSRPRQSPASRSREDTTKGSSEDLGEASRRISSGAQWSWWSWVLLSVR